MRFLRQAGARHVRVLFLFSIVANLTLLAPSFHMLQVYDRVLASGSHETLLALTLIVLFTVAVYGVAEAARLRVAQRLAAAYAVENAETLFSRLARLDTPSDASRYLREFGQARSFLSSRAFVSLFDLPFIPLFAVLLCFVHPTVCLLTVLGIVAMCAAGFLNNVLTKKSRTDSREADSKATGFAQGALTQIAEIRALGMLPPLISTWSSKSAASLLAAEESTASSSPLQGLSRSIRQGIQVLTMAWGAFLVLAGDMSGGMIFLASMISGKALGPIDQAIGAWENISKSVAAFDSVEALMGGEKRLKQRPDLPEPKGYLQARDLVFAAEGQARVIDGVSIDVRVGECVLLEGAAGTGKSVLLQLLAGAMDPQAGTVFLDGAPRERWPLAQWGRTFGYAGEEAGLLIGTVAQNVSRFHSAPDMDEVYRVCQSLGLHQTVMKLGQGYQTVISQQSPVLSASQKKLVALARALYQSPKIIILDQPDALLDVKAEAALAKALFARQQSGASIIMVTRSPLLRRLAERALGLRSGKLVRLEPAARKGRAVAEAAGASPGEAGATVANAAYGTNGANGSRESTAETANPSVVPAE